MTSTEAPQNRLPAPLVLVAFICALAILGIVAIQRREPRVTSAWSDLAEQFEKAEQVSVATTQAPTRRGSCGPRFLERRLSHFTRAKTADVLPYDTNGSGLAIGDLDGDQRPDIVLGDLRHTTSIMWNRGGFQFERTGLVDDEGGLDDSDTRHVSIVDVNGDGRNDIVTTHTGGGVSAWINLGGRRFVSEGIEAVAVPAYTMVWDDLEGDGDLDFVTASYDQLLERVNGTNVLLGSGAGVAVYERTNDNYQVTRLQRSSQALALTMVDTDADGKRELMVGNDFGVPDMVFAATGSGTTRLQWKPIEPFSRITRNTMAFALADYDRNGLVDVFATDMKPRYTDDQAVAAWMPLLQPRFERTPPNDPQRPENALQQQLSPGVFRDRAYDRGVDATGWSWGAQFGDLDLDGDEDLYVVNGMIDDELLGHLNNAEVVEQNVTFRNNGDGSFDRETTWGLGVRASGRSVAMADLDQDGRLDVVINNLDAPAVILENRLCTKGSSLQVRLRWAGKQNNPAFGSSIVAVLTEGQLLRTVNPAGGYLTSLDGTVHFGIPAGRAVNELQITWPDGKASRVAVPQTQTIVTVTRDDRQ
jgi:enediyne biosynthesis protein E4